MSPCSFGDAFIHVDDIDLFSARRHAARGSSFLRSPTKIETAIGERCAALIEDGACLQMGIGAIPNAVLAQLGGQARRISAFIPRCSPTARSPPVESGVIDGRNKAIDQRENGLPRS